MACDNPASASAVSFLASTTGHSYLQHPTCEFTCSKRFALLFDQRCKLTTKEDANLLAIRYALAVMGIGADTNILTCEYKGFADSGRGEAWMACKSNHSTGICRDCINLRSQMMTPVSSCRTSIRWRSACDRVIRHLTAPCPFISSASTAGKGLVITGNLQFH